MAATVILPKFGDVRLVYKGKVIYEGKSEGIADIISRHEKFIDWMDSHDKEGNSR